MTFLRDLAVTIVIALPFLLAVAIVAAALDWPTGLSGVIGGMGTLAVYHWVSDR